MKSFNLAVVVVVLIFLVSLIIGVQPRVAGFYATYFLGVCGLLSYLADRYLPPLPPQDFDEDCED